MLANALGQAKLMAQAVPTRKQARTQGKISEVVMTLVLKPHFAKYRIPSSSPRNVSGYIWSSIKSRTMLVEVV